MADAQHYTFGDNETAGQRLLLLAEAFAPSSAQLLRQVAGEFAGTHAVDLGCGPGETTALVQRIVRPASITGLDVSPRLIEWATQRAARRGDTHVQFRVHDVTRALRPALPVADIDPGFDLGFVYSRFLLTHLSAPSQVLATWAAALGPGGAVLLEETSALGAEHPVLQRYYQMVAQLQAAYGQKLLIGDDLLALVPGAVLQVAHAATTTLAMPARIMARLHALNIGTWRQDRVAQATFEARALDQVAAGLEAIAAGSEAAGDVSYGLGQVFLRRRPM